MDRNQGRDRFGLGICQSLSARRAWIEIVEFHLFASSGVSLSARRAWIEIETRSLVPQTVKSLSARRAWIEIATL